MLPPVARHQRTLPKLADPDAPLLVVEDLKTYFTLESGTVKAVDGVSFTARAGGGARHRRRVGLRQDDDRAVAGAGPAVQREHRRRQHQADGHRPGAEVRERAAPLPLARGVDRLPGRDERPQPGPARARPDRRADRGAAGRLEVGRAQAGGRAARARRHPARSRGRLSARALGRDAPAGDDRDGPRVRPGARHRRRADDGPGRHGPGPDPQAARGPARQARAVADPHHPRPVGHRRDVRPGHGHVRRPRRRGRPGRRGVHPAAPPVHPEAARGLPEHPRRPADARGHPGLAAGPAQPAAGLPVRAALLVRDGHLHGGRAARDDVRCASGSRAICTRRRRPQRPRWSPGSATWRWSRVVASRRIGAGAEAARDDGAGARSGSAGRAVVPDAPTRRTWRPGRPSSCCPASRSTSRSTAA